MSEAGQSPPPGNEGRAHVFPQAIGFGARPVAVPGRGDVLCVSGLFPFRVADGSPVRPTDWYREISLHGGDNAIPDTMTPLPGAELLVLGTVPPVVDAERRRAFVRCGSVVRNLELRPDPDAPSAPLDPGPEAAAWHEEENPVGRGGPDDNRKPLIVNADDPSRPVWLGATPFDHPTRLAAMGTPDAESGTGWPKDATAEVFHDAHPAFRAESFHPGDPLVCQGLDGEDIDTVLPPYRMTFSTICNKVDMALLPPRIMSVMVIPKVGIAAVIWRASMHLGDDTLGEKVHALVAAMEDVDAPEQDETHWCDIAVTRWLEPEKAADDRPLLPAALAAVAASPFAIPEGDGVSERIEAAQEWMRDEAGMPENPFEDDPKKAEVDGLLEQMDEETGEDDEPPDGAAVANIATAAMAAAKQRHEKAGFPEPEEDIDAPRMPLLRADSLNGEIDRRLQAPYQSEQDRALRDNAKSNPDPDLPQLDPDEMLTKIADVRMTSPKAPLPWPALVDEEALAFGAAVAKRINESPLERHIDISCAAVGTVQEIGAEALGGAVAGSAPFVAFVDKEFVGLLAEETMWRDVEFDQCRFDDSTFAGARFFNCRFRTCTFRKVNFSSATFDGCEFQDCGFDDINCMEFAGINLRFVNCRLTRVNLMDPAMRDSEFVGGEWTEVQFMDGLLIRIAFRDMRFDQVTFGAVHAPHTTFERVSMYKFFCMSKGFPGSTFDQVEAETCGFVSSIHFDECRLSGVRFTETGFTGASFAKAELTGQCCFETCDFSSAIFSETQLAGTRFLQCTMATSIWLGSDATEAWFMGAALRGVNFNDTDLHRAVFTDSDLAGVDFEAHRTIGADFRGTERDAA